MTLQNQRIQSTLSRIKYDVRSWMAQYPKIFFPLVNLKYESRTLAVRQETQLVIEGFPRSGNSFAVSAFQTVQPSPLVIANHLHAPAQIILAARRGIPTLVLIRHPVDAVLSFKALAIEAHLLEASSYLNLSMNQLFQSYIRFYKRILPYREQYIIVCFEDLIQDFGVIIQKINQHFYTSFHVFEHTEDSVQKVFEKVGFHAGPSEMRKELKQNLRRELESDKLGLIVAKAENLYHQFRQFSVTVSEV